MKSKYILFTICTLIFSIILITSKLAVGNDITITIRKDTYYDKALAGIIGQVGGLLTGFEFVNGADGKPYVGLPDDWFSICNEPNNESGGLVLETQKYPDAPNHPNFPAVMLYPGEEYLHIGIYKFGILK